MILRPARHEVAAALACRDRLMAELHRLHPALVGVEPLWRHARPHPREVRLIPLSRLRRIVGHVLPIAATDCRPRRLIASARQGVDVVPDLPARACFLGARFRAIGDGDDRKPLVGGELTTGAAGARIDGPGRRCARGALGGRNDSRGPVVVIRALYIGRRPRRVRMQCRDHDEEDRDEACGSYGCPAEHRR